MFTYKPGSSGEASSDRGAYSPPTVYQFIRFIDVQTHPQPPMPATGVQQLLGLRRAGEALFPNLRTLLWKVPYARSGSLQLFWHTARLHSVNIDGVACRDSSDFPQEIADLLCQLPSVRTFQLTWAGWNCAAMAESVAQCTTLEAITLWPQSHTSGLPELSPLPRLRRLGLTLGSSDILGVADLEDAVVTLADLLTIDFHGSTSAQAVIRALEHVQCPQVAEFYIPDFVMRHAGDIHDMSLMCAARFPHLTTVRLTVSPPSLSRPVIPWKPPFLSPIADVDPLIRMGQLQELSLVFRPDLHKRVVTGTDLDTLASFLHRSLRVLCISSSPLEPTPFCVEKINSLIDVRELVHFAERCSLLSDLYLPCLWDCTPRTRWLALMAFGHNHITQDPAGDRSPDCDPFAYEYPIDLERHTPFTCGDWPTVPYCWYPEKVEPDERPVATTEGWDPLRDHPVSTTASAAEQLQYMATEFEFDPFPPKSELILHTSFPSIPHIQSLRFGFICSTHPTPITHFLHDTFPGTRYRNICLGDVYRIDVLYKLSRVDEW